MVLYPNKLPESERVCFGICTGQLQQVVPPAPVVCFIKSTVSVSELFRFLRLLQDGFSVVLYFQGGFVAHGHHIAVATF